jgi:hypothetical protein
MLDQIPHDIIGLIIPHLDQEDLLNLQFVGKWGQKWLKLAKSAYYAFTLRRPKDCKKCLSGAKYVRIIPNRAKHAHVYSSLDDANASGHSKAFVGPQLANLADNGILDIREMINLETLGDMNPGILFLHNIDNISTGLFNGLTNIIALELNNVPVTDHHMAKLAAIGRITRLTLTNLAITDKELPHFGRLIKLQITNCLMLNYNFLTSYTKLKRLVIIDRYKLIDGQLDNLLAIEEIVLWAGSLTSRAIVALRRAKKVTLFHHVAASELKPYYSGIQCLIISGDVQPTDMYGFNVDKLIYKPRPDFPRPVGPLPPNVTLKYVEPIE